MYIGLHVKYPLLLSDFNETGIFWIHFRKYPEISTFMKIHQLGTEWFQVDRRTDRHTDVHTDMTKKTVIFSNFAKEHKSCHFGSRKGMKHILKQSWKNTAF